MDRSADCGHSRRKNGAIEISHCPPDYGPDIACISTSRRCTFMPIAGRRLNIFGAVLAVAAVLLLLVRALSRFDDSWDGTHYHLVFSAFRARILTFETFQPLP